jgi:signal transduction histidine kinase
LDGALRDFEPESITTTADLPARLPLPPTVLRLLLSNLLRNAAAGGARSVHVSVKQRSAAWLLEVEDDGVGLDSAAGYRRGAGLGVRLCRRIAARYGGSIVLAPGRTGGTRATLKLKSAA